MFYLNANKLNAPSVTLTFSRKHENTINDHEEVQGGPQNNVKLFNVTVISCSGNYPPVTALISGFIFNECLELWETLLLETRKKKT